MSLKMKVEKGISIERKLLSYLEQLNPEEFKMDNCDYTWWTSLDMSFKDSLDLKNVKKCIEKYAIGYCDAERLNINMDKSSYAIMFKRDDYQFWSKIQKWEIDEIDEKYR